MTLQRSDKRPISANAVLLSLAAVKLLIHVLVNAFGGYGYFRDELYYIACTDHLDIGYVDQPPFSIYLLALSRFASCTYWMPYENHLTISVCRKLKHPSPMCGRRSSITIELLECGCDEMYIPAASTCRNEDIGGMKPVVLRHSIL